MYCKHYKQAKIADTYGLLRKAHRLDMILNTEESDDADSESSRAFPDPQCRRCHTEFSPTFYPTPPSTPPHANGDADMDADVGTPSSSAQSWLCHQCHWRNEHDSINALAALTGLTAPTTATANGVVTNGMLVSS